MKFIHLITRNHAVLTTCAISFLSENCFKDNHFLCTLSYNNLIKNDINTNNIPNFDIKTKRSILSYIKLYNYLDKYDVVVLHGMYINRWGLVLLMLLKKQLFKKIVWIGFGQDIYEFDQRKSSSAFENIKLYFYKKCYKRIKAFIGIFPPDLEIFKSRISKNIPCYYAQYTFGKENYFNSEYMPHESIQKRHMQNKPIRILIGHRGATFYNHKKWINEFKKFKNNKIQLYIPLCGAYESYLKEVKELAKKEFGNEAIIFDKFIPYNQLIELSKNIDIAIFDSNFQVALGTIYLLFFHGVKVYLPSTSLMYTTFNEVKIPIGNLNLVHQMNFDDFIKDVDMRTGYDYVKNIKNYENSKKTWFEVFSKIAEQ